MVQRHRKGSKDYYICESCRFAYLEKQWAEKCEKFCTEHHSCSIEITKHAVEMKEA